MSHSLLNQVYTVEYSANTCTVITNVSAGCSLLDFYKQLQVPLTEAQVARIAQELLQVLGYLHQNHLAHGTLDLDCI